MDVFFWAIAPRVVFWTRFEANFRLGGNRRPLFLNGLTSPRVPGQLPDFAVCIGIDGVRVRLRSKSVQINLDILLQNEGCMETLFASEEDWDTHQMPAENRMRRHPVKMVSR